MKTGLAVFISGNGAGRQLRAGAGSTDERRLHGDSTGAFSTI